MNDRVCKETVPLRGCALSLASLFGGAADWNPNALMDRKAEVLGLESNTPSSLTALLCQGLLLLLSKS